jgi:hypothetical protein
MKKKSVFIPLVVVTALVMASMACNFQLPSPSEPQEAPTDEPLPVEEGPEPEEEIEPESEPEVAPPSSGWLPDGTIALVRTGTWGSAALKAAASDGTLTDLGVTLYSASSVSLNGRWVASTDSPAPASNVQVTSLEDGTTYSIPITTGYTVYSTAFDQVEQRLAFMELGASGGTYLWGIVIVDLADGSTTRFDTSFAIGSSPTFLPGRPIGWDSTGNLLILDTFMPDTEGNWAGIWAVSIPPGTPSAALDTLPAVNLVPSGLYLSEPVLSRDGNFLLYTNRDYSYTPADYEVMAYDLVVNELWGLALDGVVAVPYLDLSDGSALLRNASFSMDGAKILFAQGTFSGGADFTGLGWKIFEDGAPTDVGPAAIPAGGSMQDIAWCRPGTALATARQSGSDNELQILDLSSGGAASVADVQQSISILGCVP